MVDIIARRQGERKARIIRTTMMIERGIARAKSSKTGKLSYSLLCLAVQERLNISDRIAKEYIKLALFRLKKTKKDLNK